MSAVLNSQLLSKFLKAAGDRLTGEWLLVGGTLLPAVGLDIRATVDIDILSLSERGNDQQLELMELAQSLGLPVESVNSAAGFFLRKVPYTKDELIVLQKGKSAVLYRPSVRLFWALKVERLSESDLEDCLHYFKFCKKVGDPIDYAGLSQIVQKRGQGEKAFRISTLAKILRERTA